ncbi:MAG TPA: hypothetical protein VED18_04530 [Candidatus Sulfotelmatobacter sp.]|nr:hypothetical protein [Candidatus Sulfotelmatobacter sp.]
MNAHWDYILAAYGVAAVVLLGYRIYLARQMRAAEAERAALSPQRKGGS